MRDLQLRAVRMEGLLRALAAELGVVSDGDGPRRPRLRPEAGELFRRLSRRETEALNCLLENLRPGQIAQRMGVSPNTVRNHLKSVFRKTGVSSQVELLRRICLAEAEAPASLPSRPAPGSGLEPSEAATRFLRMALTPLGPGRVVACYSRAPHQESPRLAWTLANPPGLEGGLPRQGSADWFGPAATDLFRPGTSYDCESAIARWGTHPPSGLEAFPNTILLPLEATEPRKTVLLIASQPPAMLSQTWLKQVCRWIELARWVEEVMGRERQRSGRLYDCLSGAAALLRNAGIDALLPPTHSSQDLQRCLDALTIREREVLRGLLNRQRVPDIATAMYLSPHTVRNHLKSIYRKVGIHGQQELIRRLTMPDTPRAGGGGIPQAATDRESTMGAGILPS